MNIRKIQPRDVDGFWQLQCDLDEDTPYMMYEPGERVRDLARIRQLVEMAVRGDNLLLVSEDQGKLVGYLSAERGIPRRIRHTVYIVTGILTPYQRQGIGTRFFMGLESWAKQNNVSRLELTVMCANAAARSLYEKCGFEVEGVRRNAMRINGEFADEMYMAKLI